MPQVFQLFVWEILITFLCKYIDTKIDHFFTELEDQNISRTTDKVLFQVNQLPTNLQVANLGTQ